MINIYSEVKLHRVFYYITIKIIKNYVFSSENPAEICRKMKKIENIRSYLLIIMSVLHKYLLIYSRVLQEKQSQNKIDKSFSSLSSSEEENHGKFNRKMTCSCKLSMIYNHLQGVSPYFEKKRVFQKDYRDFMKNFDLKTSKKLNIKFEIEEFVRFMLETLILEAVLLRNSENYRESFLVLNQGVAFTRIFESSSVLKTIFFDYSSKILIF